MYVVAASVAREGEEETVEGILRTRSSHAGARLPDVRVTAHADPRTFSCTSVDDEAAFQAHRERALQEHVLERGRRLDGARNFYEMLDLSPSGYARPTDLRERSRCWRSTARREGSGRRHGPDHPAPRRDVRAQGRGRRQADSRAGARDPASTAPRPDHPRGTVMTEIHDSPLIQERFPALAEAARFVGSVQIRNRATLVGNMCNASPAADTAPPLLVYQARLAIAGPDGEREIALDDFFVKSGVTTLGAGRAGDGGLVAAARGSPRVSLPASHPAPRTRSGVCDCRRGGRSRRAGRGLRTAASGPRPLVFEGRDDSRSKRGSPAASPSPTSMRAGTRLPAGHAPRPH